MAQINADSASVVLNGSPVNDFLEGDFIEINPVNPLTSQTNGGNGAVNINKRIDGDVHDVVIRLLRYSQSDVFMNNLINQDSPTLIDGSIKESYVQGAEQAVENWILANGSITTRPSVIKNNQDGNDQMEYTIRFRSATRLV